MEVGYQNSGKGHQDKRNYITWNVNSVIHMTAEVTQRDGREEDYEVSKQ